MFSYAHTLPDLQQYSYTASTVSQHSQPADTQQTALEP